MIRLSVTFFLHGLPVFDEEVSERVEKAKRYTCVSTTYVSQWRQLSNDTSTSSLSNLLLHDY